MNKRIMKKIAKNFLAGKYNHTFIIQQLPDGNGEYGPPFIVSFKAQGRVFSTFGPNAAFGPRIFREINYLYGNKGYESHWNSPLYIKNLPNPSGLEDLN